ncbi:MFS transporter [Amnibacterium flavum]|uniref:MFS transporter n=1 Tax=Amnibacterium flavum TaxID=2173173 RepID=A0A2V1HWU0_9MICO|nr:MFS transporter [Amnibacterium flavum]PVZ95007.1 MFS transporter [Amnibacterium flavum]
MQIPSTPARFPTLGLAVLAAAIFVSITGEFLPTGLLPDMARDLRVSEAQVGLLITVFAGTVVIATAPLAALTRKYPRHTLVIAVLCLNALATLGSALAPSYEFLVAARVVAGVAHGLFWACVGAYPAHLVEPRKLGKAMAITGAGGSAAFVLGVPLATALGHAVGWRIAFLIIAAIMVVCAALVWKLLPTVAHGVPLSTGEIALPLRRDSTVPTVLAFCVVIIVIIAGQNLFYTYIAPYIIGPLGFDASAVGPLLFLYGGAGIIGLLLAGMAASRFPVLAIVVTGAGSAVALIGLAVFAGVPWAVIALLIFWGILQGFVAPLYQTHMMQIASLRVRDNASAWMTTAFNVGIGGGALVGALILGSLGLETLPWIGAVTMLVGVVIAVVMEATRRPAKGSRASASVNATQSTSI